MNNNANSNGNVIGISHITVNNGNGKITPKSTKQSPHSPSNYSISSNSSSNHQHHTNNMNTSSLMMHQHQQHQQHQHSQQQHQTNDSICRDGGANGANIGRGMGRSSSCSPSSSPNRHSSAISPVASLNHSMMQQMQQHHQLSPPPHVGVGGVPSANGLSGGLPPRMPHGLPPHSLGLLNSLQMMHHASPLELMAAAHHHVPPRSYNSPPPISTSDPSANECKLVEYRGQKVAAFIISGDTMLCLPQAFELFLKHLVGGLHTVYTKLKRLDIVPLVCNVEQVRILRGLGAIQPGVNRCKLLSCKDFDILYRDCTTARCLSIKPPESNSLQFRSSRPGRPPKRGPVGLSLPPTHVSQHPQLKKHRMDNGDYTYENGHISDLSRLDKSPLLANGYNPPPINHMAFMQINHHPGSSLMSPGMPPHGLHARPDSQMLKAAAQSGMSAANLDALARSGTIWDNCRAAYEDIVKHLERLREERTDDRQSIVDQKSRDLSSRNCSPNRQSPVLNLSKSGPATDHGSNCDERSDRSEAHSSLNSMRGSGSGGDGGDGGGAHGDNEVEDEENISDCSDVDERIPKVEDLSDAERDNLSSSQHHHSQHSHHPHHSHHHSSSLPVVGASSVGDRESASLLISHTGTHLLHNQQPQQQQHQHSAHHSNSAVAAAALHQHHQRAINYSTLAATAAAAAVVANGSGGNGSRSIDINTGNCGSGGSGVTPDDALMPANTNESAVAAAAATAAAAAAAASAGLNLGSIVVDQQSTSSTETLLRNIQSLLKVAADNARHQEKQISYEKAELRMDVIREREVKDSLERQLIDERKLRVLYQKRYRRERKMRIRYQQQLDSGNRKITSNSTLMQASELERNSSGADTQNKSSPDARKNAFQDECKSSEKSDKSVTSVDQLQQRHQRQQSESPTFKRELLNTDRDGSNGEGGSGDRCSGDRVERGQRNDREQSDNCSDRDGSSRISPMNMPPTSQEESGLAAAAAAAAVAGNGKGPWNYTGIDLMATGAFWQNYSESLAQEIEMERKTRAANSDRDVKSPLSERQQSYYKNSVLFGGAT